MKGLLQMCDISIRNVTSDDAEELLEIYAPYVAETAISFEIDIPTAEDFRSRIEHTLKNYPYIAAVKDGHIVGYAYASAFHPREAYNRCAELTVYIKKDMRRSGCGRLLYTTLEDMLKKQNVLNAYACIAYTEHEDAHLTNDSMRFHEHMGYRLIGRFISCGRKFDSWYDMIWMEKLIGEHTCSPAPFIPYEKMGR